MDESKPVEAWVIVELMGHDRSAGRYKVQDGLHRVDVPQDDGSFVSELYGNGAIFRIRFVDEAAARLAARQCRPQPFGVWELRREMARLMAPAAPGEAIEPDPDEEGGGYFSDEL